MKSQQQINLAALIFFGVLMFSQCNEKKAQFGNSVNASVLPAIESNYNGFESQVAWGQHLVTIAGCNDCHTPKKMTAYGPVLDSTLLLSGHPLQNPAIDINRKEIESKGLAVTSDLTEWVGPWGVSYAANLTPDPTGIGSWDEAQFIYCLRNGKLKGLPGSRTLLPPMPWDMYKNMKDDEIKAIFAFLKSLKPVNNLVPAPLPPSSMVN